ncbi:MAG: glycosyltransferase [Desulfovibrionaceae bacterium]|nr:glycosyltransferase [Desulfovibrionaceae bacterium]
MMRTVFFIPALHSMSGGLANIYSVARNLKALGRQVALMGPDRDAAGLKEAEAEGFAVLPWGTKLTGSDTWCVPESWPNAFSVGFSAGAKVLVYVQSWVYMLSNLPQGIRWKQLPLEYLAVSHPVAWFMREVLALEARDIVPPAIDDIFFRNGNRPGSHVRAAYMPRKNRALAEQIQRVASACLAERPNSPRLEWVEIHKKTRAEVAELLSSCHLFVSTGFPEGFGLPPLEAMASGCVPVGFTGFGGWEYMRQSHLSGFPPPGVIPTGPPYVLPPSPQDACGNGFFSSDGDTLGAGLALAHAATAAHENSENWRSLCRSCRETAARYNESAQKTILDRVFR